LIEIDYGNVDVNKYIATISGDEGAISIRDFAASELLPEDLEAAQKRAAELYEEIQQRQG
jgi:hypothetical protein